MWLDIVAIVAIVSNVGLFCASAYFFKNGDMNLFGICSFGLVCQTYNTWANYICQKEDRLIDTPNQALEKRNHEFFEKRKNK